MKHLSSRNVPISIALTSAMGDFMHAEIADMHHMYGRANGNGRVALRMYHAQFSDRQMPDHRIFQWLHPQLRETRPFHVARHSTGIKKVYTVQVWKKAHRIFWLINPSQTQELLLIT
ncbi:hypothetical protein TNCV_2733311 [Trichonephila clavipes]|nr:hypothetical protein TNCV_2733311 [Trichonephila clavipes]